MTPTKPRILIVDDEPSVSSTLRAVLEDGSIEVDTAESAEAALVKVRAVEFDLLVLDKNLPDMSGPDLLRSARAIRPEVRALLMTGYASVESAVDVLNLGIEGYLEKPFADIFAVADRIKTAAVKPPWRAPRVAASRASSHFSRATQVLVQAQRDHSVRNPVAVLLVAPDGDDRRWLQTHLERDGDHVTPLADLAAARQAISKDQPPVLVIDTDIGDDELFTLLGDVQRNSPRTLPCVVTLRPGLTLVTRLIDAGARALVEKPLTDEAFEDKIVPLLAAARVDEDERPDRF